MAQRRTDLEAAKGGWLGERLPTPSGISGNGEKEQRDARSDGAGGNARA